MNSYKKTIADLLDGSGIAINGSQSHDLQVHEEKLYQRILSNGSLGLGEAYIEEWWDCDNLEEFFFRALRADLDYKIKNNFKTCLQIAKAIVFNQQNKSKSLKVAKAHYDAGNDLYKAMLDKRMIYSCGYWENASTLDEAQENKLDLICRKLKLSPGMRMLDIGCGWGGLAQYAAEKYRVSVTGVTISENQAKLASENCRNLPVEIKIQDYRDVDGKFDRIVSVGMFEHVGYKNYKKFMATTFNLLKDDGLFLLHTIGGNSSVKNVDAWIDKYIFPNGMLPSAEQICNSIGNKFKIEDWHNFGPHYHRTLMCWLQNFEESWPLLSKKYSNEFYRIWRYYLCSCAASFRARKNNLWQIVFSKENAVCDYSSVR
ncbi:MAG TPA: cyclopropane fatty acyl phospholipid synthase [Mucilaginibacter sp.]|jgi:cyclopropane-fatty-acyl-phospholipid synthase